MKLIPIKKINKKKWSKFVYDHHNGNIFQTPEMYDIYENIKNYQPLFICIVENHKDILGLLISTVQKEWSGPMSGLTSRCVTWGGPLIKKDLKETERKNLLDFILKEQNKIVKKKAIYMKFRNRWDASGIQNVFTDNGYIYEEELNILIDLSKSEDILWTELTKNRRKGIKRAIREDHEFSEFPRNESLEEFYRTIEKTYNDVNIPLADISFFNITRKIMDLKKMVKYMCIKNENELIATRIVLLYKDIIYDWYTGSIEKGKRSNANELLVWNILLWGHKNGYKVFDFGGAGNPNE